MERYFLQHHSFVARLPFILRIKIKSNIPKTPLKKQSLEQARLNVTGAENAAFTGVFAPFSLHQTCGCSICRTPASRRPPEPHEAARVCKAEFDCGFRECWYSWILAFHLPGGDWRRNHRRHRFKNQAGFRADTGEELPGDEAGLLGCARLSWRERGDAAAGSGFTDTRRGRQTRLQHQSGRDKSALINNSILGGCFHSRQTLWNYSFGSGSNMQTAGQMSPPGVRRQKAEAEGGAAGLK